MHIQKGRGRCTSALRVLVLRQNLAHAISKTLVKAVVSNAEVFRMVLKGVHHILCIQ